LAALDFEACEKQLEEKHSELANREIKINKLVSGTLFDLEKEFNKTSEEKWVVEDDSIKIRIIIKDLDDEEEKELMRRCTEVDTNIGEIFSSMLPGAKANLVRFDRNKELELRVSLRGVTKNNLDELSGGQRSLLSLAFILSMLKCRRAPLYIFDEIDAALDVSYTDSISSMVRSCFAGSQFIVVSLKEGMYRNANVLFRTQFLDGRSVVERQELMPQNREG
jgi:structural maintenance of chromosome 2